MLRMFNGFSIYRFDTLKPFQVFKSFHAFKVFAQVKKILLFSLLLSSCKPELVLDQKVRIAEPGWTQAQTIAFTWEIQDTQQLYGMYLTVGHQSELSYRNLYIKSLTTFPNQTKKDQIISLELYDETGNPYGDCSASSCNTEIELQGKTKFPEPGSYQLELQQYSRLDTFAGIRDFHLRIRPLEEHQ